MQWFKPRATTGLFLLLILIFSVIGCNPNNNQNINTANAKLLIGGTVVATPLGSQPVAAQWQSDLTGGPNGPYGTTYSFQGVTTPYVSGQPNLIIWPTFLSSTNDRMPAYWTVEWSHPPYCVSQTPPYALLQNPFIGTFNFEPTSAFDPYGPNLDLFCFTNSPADPGFIPTNIYPQLALDDALPATIRVAALSPVSAPPSSTHLHVFGTDLSNPANVTAIAVANNGSSAVFPYPMQANGTPLPAGAYVVSMTTDPSGSPQTTNAMEAFYVVHDDRSYPGAYGVAVASPKTVTTHSGPIVYDASGQAVCTKNQTTGGGVPLTLVTLLTENALAVGSASNTKSVGVAPTVVIPFHDNPVTRILGGGGFCRGTIIQYSGAQSALVVNTGGNSLSVVQIGDEQFPSGMINVGNQPVAAVINPAETMAYVANYADGTVSEVNLTSLAVTRTIGVMANPSAIAFDANGNLWVGGQGAVMNVNVGAWSIASNVAIDGTINGMTYDTQSGMLIQTLLQNGSPASPSNGTTGASRISYGTTQNSAYGAQNAYSVATGASSIFAATSSDIAPYSLSSVSPLLAFPGQTAFNPPIYSASSGDITATVSGDMFTVSVIGTNQVLIQGILPYPARGVALVSNMVYFTIPDTNSLLSLPMQLP